MPKKPLYEAIATLVGFIIGAGILGIPFVIAKAGFITGLIDIILLGLAVMLIHLYLGEVVLRTKGHHQLTGYAETYLGKTGRRLMVFSMVFGMYGALIAYILKEGEFINALLNPIIGGNNIIYSILFFIAFSTLIYKGLKAVEESELFLVIITLIIVAVVAFFAIPFIKAENLIEFNPSLFFIPYGVIFFAYLGTGAIPEMREELIRNRKDMKKAIIIGSLIPVIVYILFAFIVVGVTGKSTTDGSIIGLGNALGNNMLVFGTILGILTMATSFIAVGLALKEMYNFDFKLTKAKSSALTCFIPLSIALIIIFSKIHNAFFRVLDITGALAGSLVGILVVLMFLKAKKLGQRKPEYSLNKNLVLGIILIILFITGIIHKFWSLFM